MENNIDFELAGPPVCDLPPKLPEMKRAICRTPDELLAYRKKFRMPTYAVRIVEEDKAPGEEVWLFSNDLQDAVAAGLHWHKRKCCLTQYPLLEEVDGEIVYAYRINNFRQATEYLYNSTIWNKAGADQNELATPEIMMRVRQAFFEFCAEHGEFGLILLDFSCPDGEAGYLQDWADELGL